MIDRRRFLDFLAGLSVRPFAGWETAPPADTTPVPVTVGIDRTAPGATIASDFLGLSFEKSLIIRTVLSGSDTKLAGLLRGLGGGVLRIGGNSVDQMTWQPEAAGSTWGAVAPADVDRLASLTRASGWRILYGVNMAAHDTAAAAAEVAYSAQAFGASLMGIEIGNEPDQYQFNGIRPRGYDYAAFSREWDGFARAIRARTPGVVLSGPASAADVVRWTVPFAHDHADAIALLTQHYYRGNGMRPDSTVALLLRPDARLHYMLGLLQAAAADNRISQSWRMNEANSYYHGGALNVSDAYGSALWVLDFLLTLAHAGASGVNLHGGGNSPGYTPIGDNGTQPVNLRPVYYGMRLFSGLAGARLLPTTQDAGALNFTAQAAATPEATLLLLVNKDAARKARVRLPAAGTAQLTRLTGPALDSTGGLLLGGAPIALDGSWTPQPEQVTAKDGVLQVDVAPASAVLAKLA